MRWSESREYLYAIDLFNHGYYWEAHEVWEGLWHAAGRKGALADFLKGLIKLAAAGVKIREGRSEGASRHSQRAKALFESVRATVGTQEYCALSIDDLIEKTEQVKRTPPTPAKSLDSVQIVFAFSLEPRLTALHIDELDPR
jgi:hypothetical protein